MNPLTVWASVSRKLSLWVWATLLLPAWVMAGINVNGLTHEHIAEPGQRYEGVIQITNNGQQPTEVKLYQTDYVFYADGRNDYGEQGKLPRSNANWIRFSPQRPLIPPKSSVEVQYQIKIPDIKLRGSYWSMIMVEEITAKAAESRLRDDEPVVRVTQSVRYGIQMITHIGDTGSRSLKFNKIKLHQGKLAIDIENTGERMLRSGVQLNLFDPQGQWAGQFEAGKKRTYPGTSVRYQIDLSKVRKGQYHALLVADAGGDDVFGMQFELKIK